MPDFTNQKEAIDSVIEFFSSKGYSEGLLAGIKELLIKYSSGNDVYDDLATYFDKRLQLQNIYYDYAKVYQLMMSAILLFSEYIRKG